MNQIWECLVTLKRLNPKSGSKYKYLYDKAWTLIIMDPEFNVVDLQTNEMVMDRNIRKDSNGFTSEDINMICIIKYIGPSYATF